MSDYQVGWEAGYQTGVRAGYEKAQAEGAIYANTPDDRDTIEDRVAALELSSDGDLRDKFRMLDNRVNDLEDRADSVLEGGKINAAAFVEIQDRLAGLDITIDERTSETTNQIAVIFDRLTDGLDRDRHLREDVEQLKTTTMGLPDDQRFATAGFTRINRDVAGILDRLARIEAQLVDLERNQG